MKPIPILLALSFSALVGGIGAALFLALTKREVEADKRLDCAQEEAVFVYDMGGVSRVEPQSEITSTLFDCPECNMPAEVVTYVTMWDPDSELAMTYVVINCLSDHDLITVTQEWFVDHVLSQPQE